MASLSGNGIPVVAKTSLTYRMRGGRQIYRENSVDDAKVTIVNAPPARAITSGSIVRDNGTVEYYEDRDWGLYMAGRSNMGRIASSTGNLRTTSVDLAGNVTQAVIPSSLAPHTPQIGVFHLGNKIGISQAVTSQLVERVANSGSL